MGRSDHLQDAPQLYRPAGHEQLGSQLWPGVRDMPGSLPVVHPRHGQGSAHVPAQVSGAMVAAGLNGLSRSSGVVEWLGDSSKLMY